MSTAQERRTVGVIINNLDSEYQRDIWRGIEGAASETDTNVIVLLGGTLDSPNEYTTFLNRVYDFVTPEKVDGLILVSGTLEGQFSLSELVERLRSLLDVIPAVNIGPPSRGLPSVSVNNEVGLRAILEHLIVEHGKKKLVLMGGPHNNPDAEERKSVFLELLGEHGLEPAEDGLLEGKFRTGLTIEVLNGWLDLGHDFDAIVAANDEMAEACYHVLVDRDYQVPKDIALVGFDDTPAARFSPVPLTTVMQPVRELGRLAYKTLIRSIETGRSPGDHVLETTPVVRESCGCFSQVVKLAGSSVLSPDQAVARAEKITGEDELAAAFSRAVADPAVAMDFLLLFQNLLRDQAQRYLGSESWENCITRLRLGLRATDEKVRYGETLLHQARIMVKDQAVCYQASLRLNRYNSDRNIQFAVASLISSFSLRNLILRLGENLHVFGIRSCYLSLFVAGTEGERSRLVLAYTGEKQIALSEGGLEFDTVDLAPKELVPVDRRYNFIVELLSHGPLQMGLLVVELMPGEFILSYALTSQICSALRASLLVDELVEKDAKLNTAFDQLKSRADELEKANSLIKQNQERLLVSEKMASLGRLTAGIAHEMNTPLAAVRAAIMETVSLVHEYKESVGDAEVSAEDHIAIASDMEKVLDIAGRAAEQASTFIGSIKNQSRDSPADARGISFDVGVTIRDTLVLLGYAARRRNCRIDFAAPDTPVTISGKPGKLSQILTNLVMNAIEAMSAEGGAITLTLEDQVGEIVISVLDTGCGISPENLPRIFDPLFTTKPFGEGTGLGLTIVHDLVSGDFGGSIDVKSALGEGTRFSIRIPKIR